jgi:hypothetical protein
LIDILPRLALMLAFFIIMVGISIVYDEKKRAL